jgi:hypothetical protein
MEGMVENHHPLREIHQKSRIFDNPWTPINCPILLINNNLPKDAGVNWNLATAMHYA